MSVGLVLGNGLRRLAGPLSSSYVRETASIYSSGARWLRTPTRGRRATPAAGRVGGAEDCGVVVLCVTSTSARRATPRWAQTRRRFAVRLGAVRHRRRALDTQRPPRSARPGEATPPSPPRALRPLARVGRVWTISVNTKNVLTSKEQTLLNLFKPVKPEELRAVLGSIMMPFWVVCASV